MEQSKTAQKDIYLIGISAETSFKNETSPDTSVIAHTVGRYQADNLASHIPGRIEPGVTIAAYTNYKTDEYGEYTYFIGEAVESLDQIPDGYTSLTIPAGEYTKFTTQAGPMPTVVINAWQNIWSLNDTQLGGARAYKADFEVYDQRAADPGNAVLDIYIGLAD